MGYKYYEDSLAFLGEVKWSGVDRGTDLLILRLMSSEWGFSAPCDSTSLFFLLIFK